MLGREGEKKREREREDLLRASKVSISYISLAVRRAPGTYSTGRVRHDEFITVPGV